jgi:isocitrate dehydrogenase kinase/phosphatase
MSSLTSLPSWRRASRRHPRWFEQYHARFAAITARARQRFEQRDWAGARQDAVERIALYDLCIAEQMDALRRLPVRRSASARCGCRCTRATARCCRG